MARRYALVPNAPSSVAEILDRLAHRADKSDSVSVGSVLEALGSRSYGPFLTLPALLVLTPIGAIPAVPSLLAGVIVLFAAQMLLGREQMWLPGVVERASASSDRMKASIDKLRPVAAGLDRWFHGRLEAMTRGPSIQIASAGCIALALTVPPLELLPFASAAPMLAIAMFGLALTVKDGVLMLIAIAVMVAAVTIGVGLWLTPG